MKHVVDNRFYEISDYWGNKMPMMAMEEAGELIQAISKVERANKRTVAYCDAIENLMEEMADTIIAVNALMARYDIDTNEMEKVIKNKLYKEYDEND